MWQPENLKFTHIAHIYFRWTVLTYTNFKIRPGSCIYFIKLRSHIVKVIFYQCYNDITSVPTSDVFEIRKVMHTYEYILILTQTWKVEGSYLPLLIFLNKFLSYEEVFKVLYLENSN